MSEKHMKQTLILKGWCAGRNWNMASRAIEMAKEAHQGMRKNGIDPEANHLVYVGHYVRTLSPMLIHPEETLCAALLHDSVEDAQFSLQEIKNLTNGKVARAVDKLSKKKHLSDEVYYAEISRCPIASIVKGCDRISNLETMHGAFTHEKMLSYVNETDRDVVPTIKNALKLWTEQELAYRNILNTMYIEMKLVRQFLQER